MADKYVCVRNWRKFQHYDPAKRVPPWIKLYTGLMNDENFLDLTCRQRGILVSLWLVYAKSTVGARSMLGASVANLRRRLGDPTVRQRDLDALVQAGFIEIVASKTLAERYLVEVEVEEEKEEEPSPPPPSQPKRSKSTPARPAKVPASLAKRDELWDTFDTELGPVATKSERGRRNRALKDLREIGVTPAELVAAIAAYRRRWSDIDVTETAIAANWSTLLRPNPNGKLGPVELMQIARGERTLQ